MFHGMACLKLQDDMLNKLEKGRTKVGESRGSCFRNKNMSVVNAQILGSKGRGSVPSYEISDKSLYLSEPSFLIYKR